MLRCSRRSGTTGTRRIRPRSATTHFSPTGRSSPGSLPQPATSPVPDRLDRSTWTLAPSSGFASTNMRCTPGTVSSISAAALAGTTASGSDTTSRLTELGVALFGAVFNSPVGGPGRHGRRGRRGIDLHARDDSAAPGATRITYVAGFAGRSIVFLYSVPLVVAAFAAHLAPARGIVARLGPRCRPRPGVLSHLRSSTAEPDGAVGMRSALTLPAQLDAHQNGIIGLPRSSPPQERQGSA